MKYTSVVAVFAVVLTASVASAQPPVKPIVFAGPSGKQLCAAALASGNYRVYEPTYFNLHDRNPTNGMDRIRVQLEVDMCIKMRIVGGVQFVVQRAGTWFRALKMSDGSLALYARDDCGNEVFDVSFPAPPLPVEPQRLVIPEIVSQPERPRQLMTPVVIQPPPPPDDEEESEGDSRWGITAGAMLGEFDSVPIGRAINRISGRTVCMKGREFDLGVAHGDVESSVWRLTFALKSIREGSFTQRDCPNCGEEVKTIASSGVHVLGVQLERQFRISVHEGRGIQPMVEVHVGAGLISGKAHEQTLRNSVVTATRNVDASALMNSKVFPIAGAGVGFMGALSDHVGYAVTVAGIEYPGRYYGRIALTYWP